jgi:hypothetical protein
MQLVRRTSTLLFAIIAVFLVFAVASCESGPPTESVLFLDRTADGSSSGAASHVAEDVTGHIVNGHGVVWVESRSQHVNISFHARQHADGSVHGSWHHQFRSRTPGGRIKVDLTCLGVSENEAWLAGHAVQAGSDANLGKWFGLHVIDHGEGHGAADEMSRSLWFGFDPEQASDFCSTMPIDHDVWPVEAGNVQVR